MKNKIKSIFLFLSLSLIVLTSSSQNLTLDLRYRTIDFDKEIKLSVQDIKSASYHDTIYIIAHFKYLPNLGSIQSYQEFGVALLDYLGSNTYVISIPASSLNDFQYFPAFHSYHKILALDKTHASLTSNLSIDGSKSVSISLNWFKGINGWDILNELKLLEAEVLYYTPALNNVVIRLAHNKIIELAQQAWVSWMEPLPPPFTTSNLPGRTAIRSNVLNKPINGRKLTGQGVNMGIWDAGPVGSHIDYNSRLTIRETDYPIHSHGTHVTGTMAGAGILDPYYKGMAPEAKIFSYDFYWWIPHEMDSAYQNDKLVITQNSYYYTPSWDTCYKRGYYDIMSFLIDRLVDIYPNYMHVYAAGNAQSQCNQGGYRTMASGPHASKNALIVGAVDYKDVMSGFSNWGPVRDGRLKPEICGDGVGVKSTVHNDGYSGSGSGTSFACPSVSGTIAQLYQLYRQLYSKDPEASTIKAIVCNTALDLGREGPDYQHGFGRLDGLKSAEAIENKYFLYDSISNSQVFYDSILIDSSIKELKVMLCWTDPPTSAYKKEDSISLINHLDLKVYDALGNPFYPFVLDPFNPDSNATKGTDTLNNIEQVVLKNPTPGKYIFAVEGKIIPIGYQTFSLSWLAEKNHIKVTYPIGHESLTPTNTEIIRWNAFGNGSTFKIEFSIDSGSNWQILKNSIPATQLYYEWSVPSISSDQCLIRVSSGALSSESENCFSIMYRAEKPFVDACKQNVLLTWNKVQPAKSYNVFELHNDHWTWQANVIDTFYYHLISSDLKKAYYSIKAVDSNGVRSEFSPAVSSHNPIMISMSTSADTICFGQSVSINATASEGKIRNYIYQWPGFSGNSSTLADTPNNSTFYFVEVWDSCTLSPVKDSIYVVVRAPLSVSLIADKDSICLGDTVQLVATNNGGLESNYHFYWLYNLSSDKNLSVQPSKSTTYYCYLTDSCSTSSVTDSIRIIVRDALHIKLTASENTICEGEELIVNSNASGGDPNSYQFNWDPPLSHGLKLKTFPSESNFYKLHISDNCNPIGITDSIFVPVQDMNSSWTYFADNLLVHFKATDSSALYYKWYFGDGDSSTLSDPSHIYNAKGSYSVCLETRYIDGCMDSTCLSFFVEDNGLFENQLSRYSVYPNPSQGIFIISSENSISLKLDIRVISCVGKEVFSQTILSKPGHNDSIDLRRLEKGLYFIELNSGSQIYTQKIIIY